MRVMFTQQHFEKTARILSKNFAIAREGAEKDTVTLMVVDFANVFEADNPRFKRHWFYRAVSPGFAQHLASYGTGPRRVA